jgi:hypothetical protein
MRVLSVDWDYFFPDIAWYDWGHREAPLFIETLWSLRCANHNLFTGERAIDAVHPDPDLLKSFWSRRISQEPGALLVSESHAALYYWLKDWTIDELVSFDQHHDLGYPSAKGTLDCGNWAGKLLNEKRVKRFTLVYPPWRQGKKQKETEMPKRKEVTVLYDKEEVPRGHYDAVFICRSGSWTPSWCDDDFIQFVTFWVGHTVWDDVQFSDYDPMIERSPNKEEARRLAKESKENMTNLDALKSIQEQYKEKQKEEKQTKKRKKK